MERDVSDADRLFRRFAESGDPRALGEVYDLLGPELLRIALHTARDAAEAEDVLQATFVTAIERADRFDRTQRVMPWLCGILANESRKARARAARTPDPARVERAESRDPELEAERAELLARLDAALERVPAAYRPVLTLRLRHGLSIPEIAAALERPSGTVRSQLARGTDVLRRTLPAGLAGALLLAASPTRGLAAVRNAILEHAALLHGSPTVAAAIVGGVIAVKKWIAAAVVIVSALWLWNATRDETSAPVVESPSIVADTSLDASPVADESDLAATEPVQSERAVEPIQAAPATQPAAAPLGGSLVVHARWPDGSAAAGELVLLMPPRGRSDDSVVRATGENGDARFDELLPGHVFVRLQRGRDANTRVRAGETTRVDLEILDGVTVEGRVVDSRGEPVPSASVWLSERYRTDIGHVVATTDARGEFTLRCVGADHWLGAKKRGFAPSSTRRMHGAAGDRVPLEIRLDRTASTLRGEVRDADGNALAGALILLGDAPPESVRNIDGSFSPSSFPQLTRSDGHGRFEFECAPLGVQRIQARAAGFAPIATTFDVIAGDRTECALTLPREPRVVGRVRDADGAVVFGAWVHTESTERFADSAVWSRIDGAFELTGLRTGTVTLFAQHDKHGRATREFVLAPATTTEWDVRLSPVPTIAGRVLDARGEPLEKIIVAAVRPDDATYVARSAVSDADGRFVIDGLESASYRMSVQPMLDVWRGFPLLEVDDVWPGGPPLDLRLTDGSAVGSINAEIVASDGRAVTGAQLSVWHDERRLFRSFSSEGERGAIRVESVPAGKVVLDVRHPGHPWKHIGERRIEGGDTLELGTIAFDPAGRLRVRVTGAEDAHASLKIALVGSSNRESGVAKLEGGELASGPLAPGKHLLMITADGVRQVRREFTIEEGRDTQFVLALERCGVTTVTFELPADAPKPKWIACTLLDAQRQVVWGGNADCAMTPPVAKVSAPPGSYVLMVGGEGGLTGRSEFAMSSASHEPAVVVALARKP